MQSATDDSLAITSDKGPENVQRGRKSRVLSLRGKSHRLRNALIGLGVGAGIGAGVGAASSCNHCISPISKDEAIGIAAGGLGALGAIVGALIPSDGWREVYRR